MKENGYKGAFEFSATLDYLYAYDALLNSYLIGVIPKYITHGFVTIILKRFSLRIIHGL